MNLFIERNKAAFDVTLTLSVDNITLKENFEFGGISLCQGAMSFEVACCNGMPVFSVMIDDYEWQGCCVTLRKKIDGIYLIQVFDDSSFGEAIVEQIVTKEDVLAISQYSTSIVSKLISI